MLNFSSLFSLCTYLDTASKGSKKMSLFHSVMQGHHCIVFDNDAKLFIVLDNLKSSGIFCSLSLLLCIKRSNAPFVGKSVSVYFYHAFALVDDDCSCR